jgi:GGDEF domain-containing protein
MTTLSPFLKGSRKQIATIGDRKAEALNRVVSLLLQGISLHAFQFNAAATEVFQLSIRKLRSELELVDDEDSAMLMAAAAIRLLEENNGAAEAHLQSRQNELEKVVALLSDALLDVSGSTEKTMVEIKEIERDIARARSVGALATGRARMAAAVEGIRAASRKASEIEGTVGATDGVTGLPDSNHGAAAIAEVWKHREDYYVGIFAAERLDTINLRFGFQAGDQVLQTISQHIAQQSAAGDQLFRWRGPCILKLFRRRAPEAHIASEMARTASSRLEMTLSIRDRDAIVSISTAWQLFPLQAARNFDQLILRLNEFASTRARPTGKYVPDATFSR